ncbi:hypothetical protein IU474_17955 [Nocardia otitidiscaviarum]|uniref:hypothetical protein n=1 Tax=Nocardia otitidiscaviarum TaxID=1823 RepID=UPI0018941547|nr:hypothetical protein [Nocardia otitidiscaviarum]MBF6238938.1 hypothetical protein [Nocardia otitidiscaviarum]
MGNTLTEWKCPVCGQRSLRNVGRLGESCSHCEASAFLADLPESVRSEVVCLLRQQKRLMAVVKLREGFDPPPSLPLALDMTVLLEAESAD